MKSAITMSSVIDDDRNERLWQDVMYLDEDFYHALCDHPVPLAESALRAIGPRSMVIDVYVWLAYRPHALRKDTDVGWHALYAQFGAGYKILRQFRSQFLDCLQLAMAVYPDANVSATLQHKAEAPTAPCRIWSIIGASFSEGAGLLRSRAAS